MNPDNPRDRKTLKNYFSDGARPTAQHYAALIDSGVNWMDDGFDKSQDMGWRIASTDAKALMSFYQGEGRRKPVWTIDLAHGAGDGKTMSFSPLFTRQPAGDDAPSGFAQPVVAESPVGLALTHDLRVGVKTPVPAYTLDVNGAVRMGGRLGAPGPLKTEEVLADGEWHDITETLEGCHAFEIVAGVGAERGDGRYALIHAIAMNAYNPRNPIFNLIFRRKRIRTQSAMFESFADRLQLKWETVADTRAATTVGRGAKARKEQKFNRPYKLRIRTASNYGSGSEKAGNRKDYFIRCHVTRLWFDRFMEGSRDPAWERDDAETDNHAR